LKPTAEHSRGELGEDGVLAMAERPREAATLGAWAARRFEVTPFDAVHAAADTHLILKRERGRLEKRRRRDDLEQTGRGQARLREHVEAIAAGESVERQNATGPGIERDDRSFHGLGAT
jgi:hypothetical protein